MTTDPFTTAARAEAVRAWTTPQFDGGNVIEMLGQHMAEWARARLTAQEPTDAEVEAAARALWAMRWATSWDEYSGGREPASPTGNDLRAVQVRRARAALSAARAVGRDAR